MNRGMIGPLATGILGVVVLCALGVWQLGRMDEKAAVIAQIESRILSAPGPLPDALDPARDRYMPVTLSGHFTANEVLVLASQKAAGPGFHVITAFRTQDGRLLPVDRGFIPEAARDAPRPPSDRIVHLEGNLHWPRDADRFTPDPDPARNLWFAREIGPIARHLDTEAALVVLRRTSEPEPPAQPVPVTSAGIPDDHLEYAITWFSLAAVWAGMTLFLLWRIRQQGS